MGRRSIKADYFEWLYYCVCPTPEAYSAPTYRRLFRQLYETDFYWLEDYPFDANRADDGRQLRYRFGLQHGYSRDEIELNLDSEPCSVLEMMIALAHIIEDTIMYNPDKGDRIGQWFWKMISSLNIGQYHDAKYRNGASEDIARRLDIFMSHHYLRNGEGGLFTIEGTSEDMRRIDIWKQACAYINTLPEVQYDA